MMAVRPAPAERPTAARSGQNCMAQGASICPPPLEALGCHSPPEKERGTASREYGCRDNEHCCCLRDGARERKGTTTKGQPAERKPAPTWLAVGNSYYK